MKGLKLLPEHRNLEEITSKKYYRLSKDFRKAIEMTVVYIGMLSSDKKTVEVPCLQERGFNPHLHLNDFLKGALYAWLIGKSVAFYYPDIMPESEFEEKINKVFNEARDSFELKPYNLFYKGKPLTHGNRIFITKTYKH
ncbi:hypothetical protein AYK26_07875 [Euryarchaeota archaeon SM23-78]|nr:MAG: hypothetical protein AYK26_07875 [Euryarchaeota archaeon SM23-78]